MIKIILTDINRHLHRYNHEPSMWKSLNRWNYDYSFTKNLLQTCNQVLGWMNRYEVFRWDWMIGFVGCVVGAVVVKVEDTYFYVKGNYKSGVSELVVKAVLQNGAVVKELKKVLVHDVARNNEVQFLMHQLLMYKTIKPLKSDIKKLVNEGVSRLNSQQMNWIKDNTAKWIKLLQKPISHNALNFLNSPIMDNIVEKGVCSTLRSLAFKQALSDFFKTTLNNHLQSHKNKESLYIFLRERII